ncbi:S8 family serine peptidase [Gottfriedia acidiceleris]|uniref:S8 family serine peptidase n=1 Tax=Gottfriedia acidiceleris TaxID=371036 RepID=UPI00101E0EBE|nr:S8 family serine peptidase [Gottfriedia acidiceleris]
MKNSFKVLNVLAATSLIFGISQSTATASPDTATSESKLNQQTSSPSHIVSTNTITLITGDVVILNRYSDGKLAGTLQPKEDGMPISYTTKLVNGDYYLIPDKAVAFLASGQLDEELFNITKLIEYKYDDAHRSSVPLIVTKESKNVSQSTNKAVSTGATRQLNLPSVNAVAVNTDKKQTAKFWDAVDGETKVKSSQVELTDGIEKIWLDKPVKVALDKSVPQIGAPVAWASGFDGKGIKVAVLDTGIDSNHPDVKASIKEAKNFTDDADFIDHHGHGTHVASTIAGSGSASGGRLKGVAPGADLLIGKVLNTSGSGEESWIIAGMEWAVKEGADIVSMSLGSTEASDGTDPMSQAVNQLSESSNTLFIIAAGNAGPGKKTIGAPGAAEKALTVGAVDKNDLLASFSSRGPIIENYRVKPEITAPGVGIVAARAAGTAIGTVVDDYYTSLNGTSMATPHVAGAAAILRQKHPDWSADQVKQVLVETAKPQTTYTAYQQGGGRVDIANALNANVYSSPAVVSLGSAMAEDKPIEKSFKYFNPSNSDVTLSLSMIPRGETGVVAPSGIFTLNKSGVTIPAHGSSEVKVTFNPSFGTAGDYKAVVTATGDDGKKFNTTIGATKTEPLVNLTVSTIDRNGNPGGTATTVVAYNLDTGRVYEVIPKADQKGTANIEVNPGNYSVMARVVTTDKYNTFGESVTLGGNPNIEVTKDTNMTVDARLGKEIDVRTPNESEAHGYKIGFFRQGQDITKMPTAYFWSGTNSFIFHAYVIPSKKVDVGKLEFMYDTRRYAPVIRASYVDSAQTAIPLHPVIYAQKLDGQKTLQAINVGTAHADEIAKVDISGKLAIIKRDISMKYADQIAALATAGAEGVIIVNDRPGLFTSILPNFAGSAIPAWSLNQDEGEVLIKRATEEKVMIKLDGIANSPYVYNGSLYVKGELPSKPVINFTKKNSKIVTNNYFGKEGIIGDTNPVLRPWQDITVDTVDYFPSQFQREEWYSTGSEYPAMDQVRFLHNVFPNNKNISYTLSGPWDKYFSPNTRYTENWFESAQGPGMESSKAYRKDNLMTLHIPNIGDSDGSHYGWFNRTGETSSATLSADGKEIYNSKNITQYGPITVDEKASTYQLKVNGTHNGTGWFPWATSISTNWTFQSAKPTSGLTVLPLLWPKYDLGVDLGNSIYGGRPYKFNVSIETQPGADVHDIVQTEMWTSTDDGTTWIPAKVNKRNENKFNITVNHPDSGYVSIRLKATDSAGNQVEQTILRAYSLKTPGRYPPIQD